MSRLTLGLGAAVLSVAAPTSSALTAEATPIPQPYLAIDRDFPDSGLLHANGKY
ncbi:hypothetical protein GCM10011575_30720 [Microlunatus endophyticus]|uniref:Uncharacterized protein n=1 Tax=Microlunatus endophyticus TaxID=1716077 RepID=A0A917SDI1_9ACTN|nr:hypothetical protein [Microlunatus endophyticus]GGL70025.1 hypothetical protein GCM10011575_30720 [Microlunatus endophyticus]